MIKRLLICVVSCCYFLGAHAASAIPASGHVPEPGKSPAIDRIKKNGEMRVAVLPEFPYLLESMTSHGERYYGPAWSIAKEFASRLEVKLKPVPVSHETKIPSLGMGQVDIIIAPLWVTEKREKVVDFVHYARSSLCFFGLASNRKLQKIKTIEALNDPSIRLVYFVGGPSEKIIKPLLPNITYRAVPGSGSNAPVEEIMARRADIAPIVSDVWPKLKKTIPGLRVYPSEQACMSNQVLTNSVGMAIKKGDLAFQQWLQAVVDEKQSEIDAETAALIK